MTLKQSKKLFYKSNRSIFLQLRQAVSEKDIIISHADIYQQGFPIITSFHDGKIDSYNSFASEAISDKSTWCDILYKIANSSDYIINPTIDQLEAWMVKMTGNRLTDKQWKGYIDRYKQLRKHRT